MCRKEDRVSVAQFADQRADLANLNRIETGGRFVEDQDVRIVNHRFGQADALAIPFGKMAEDAVFDVNEPATVQDLADCDVTARAGHVLELRAIAQILIDTHFQIERHAFGEVADFAADFQGFVEDVVPRERGAAAGGGQIGGQHAAWLWTCRLRWGRAVRRFRRVRLRTKRGRPLSTRRNVWSTAPLGSFRADSL